MVSSVIKMPKAKMTNRERFARALSRKTADRIPITETSFWPDTLNRWRKEGMPEDVEPLEFFGLDPIAVYELDCSLRLGKRVIEENSEWMISTNDDGVTVKTWKGSYATPLELDFTVKNRSDWERLKPRLQVDWSRYSQETIAGIKKRQGEAIFTALEPLEPCWYALRTLGHREALELMALEPTFIEDIISTQTDLVLGMLELGIQKGLKFDGLWFSSDLCYKNGMLFSPAIYKRMLAPYHRKIKEFCTRHHLFLIFHSDGDISELLPLVIEVGFDCIQPLEARAGNDVRKLKSRYGENITFFGNINMDVLATGAKGEIEEEVISKVKTAKEGGGYIYHSDQSVPPTVSFENYKFAIELAKEYGGY